VELFWRIFNMEFGMLSSLGALLLPKYLRHRSYVVLSNVLAMEAFVLPRFLIQIHLGHAMDIV
jgi:hypothetical protein